MSEIKIFISHSHKDQLFIDFVDEFLMPILLSSFRGNEIRFTSDKERITGKFPGEKSLELLDEAIDSKLFICYISKHYIESRFCLLEHGAAYINYKKNNVSFYPILSDDLDFDETLPTLNGAIHAELHKIDSLKSLYKVLSDLLIEIDEKIKIPQLDYNKKLEDWFNSLYRKNGKSHNSNGVSFNLFEKIADSFHNGSDIISPITVFCARKEYEELSIKLALKLANKEDVVLVWTLFESPLLVEDAYSNGDFLTIYDKEFKGIGNKISRYRIIVFEDYSKVLEYIECNGHTLISINNAMTLKNQYHKKLDINQITKRKKAFEEANEGALFFTTKQKIQEWCLKKFKTQLPSYFDYEFGYMATSSAIASRFGFTTGFHSNTAGSNEDTRRHMTFYPTTLDPDLHRSFEERKYSEYSIYSDIPIQIKLVDDLINDNLNKFIIKEPITLNKLQLLQ